MSDISYQNKDITSKAFAESLKNKSFKVYGINIPKIVEVLPTNLPMITANELRIDNLFLLEDGTIAIIDYESAYKEKDKIKYLQYITRILERYKKEGILDVKLKMIVIYTADISREEVNVLYDVGALTFQIEAAFLSELDSNSIKSRLFEKVKRGEKLNEDELMEFIILPLTYHGLEAQREAVVNTIQLAKEIKDETVMVYVLSGIIVFADKIIDEEVSKQVKEWLGMTKIGKLYEKERKIAVENAQKDLLLEITMNMLREGVDVKQICTYTNQTVERVEELKKILNLVSAEK